jgi:hypothetical protein
LQDAPTNWHGSDMQTWVVNVGALNIENFLGVDLKEFSKE